MTLQDFLERRKAQRQQLQDTGGGGGTPARGNRQAEFSGRINQGRRDQGIVPGDSPLVPLVDPQMAEDFGRQGPGIIGDVGGPVLGALAQMSSPAEIALLLGTAGFGTPIAAGLRSTPLVGRLLASMARPLASNFPKALGAEAAVGVGGVLGAQEVLEHTEDLHPAARIPLTIAGGVVAAGLTAGSPAVIRKTIEGAKIAGDLRYVDEAAEAYVKSRQTAEDPSFSGTVNPGGSYGKTVDTEGRIVPDVEPEAPKTPSSRMTDSIIENATDEQLVKFRDDLEVIVNKSDVVVPDVEDQINTLNVELARRGSASTTDDSASTSVKIYHGSRSTDAASFVNEDGDLVLKQSSNFGGKQNGVSFTENLESAQEYATRSSQPDGSSLAARRQYEGTVFEIDKNAAGDLLPEASGELFADGRDVIIPKGQFKALDTKALDPAIDSGRTGNVDILNHTKDLIKTGGPSEEFSFHVSGNVGGVIREGLTSGGLSGSPLTEQGYGDVVHVFRNSDLPKGDLGADISFGEGFDRLNPPKPVATFTWKQLGVDPDELGIGARAEDEGIFKEPSAREMLDDEGFAKYQQESSEIDSRRVDEIAAVYNSKAEAVDPATKDLSYEEAQKNLNKRLLDNLDAEEAEDAELLEMLKASQAEKFLDESPNRKKVVRDENIADIEDPVARATNRQVEEARTRQVLGSGVIDGPVSNIVGESGSDARRMRNAFELSDDARIRALAPIYGKHFRAINATEARRLRNAVENYPLTKNQEALIRSTLIATGFNQTVKVEEQIIQGLKSNQFGTPEELIRFARGQGRDLTIREAAELTSRNTHTYSVTSDTGAPLALVTITKQRGVSADGTPLFEMTGRGYQTDPSKLGKSNKNEYEILVESLSPEGEILGLQNRSKVNKQSRRQIMEVADEIFRQTDADVIKGGRVTGSRKGSGFSQRITRDQVNRYLNRSVVKGEEAERLQDAINNWNRPSSTDDAVIASMENDRLARKIAEGADGGGEPPPPGSYTGWDPEDLTPRARASENAMGDATEINTWEPIGQDAQRLFSASRTYEAAAVAKGVREGEAFAKARGITKWTEANAMPLYRALHNPDKWLHRLSPEMQEIYYDLKRNWVYREENDMFTFLAYAAEKNAAQFKMDMSHMASRFMAHPHYFNRIWRYFDQPEGDTINKLWKTSGTSKDPRPGFETTMEHSRNARDFDEMVDRFKFVPAMWDPYKMAAQRRMSGVEYRESIKFLTRLAERGLMDNTTVKGSDPRWAIPSGIPIMNGRVKADGSGMTPAVHVPTNMANWMEQVWTSPDTLFSDPVLFNKSIRQWSTISKLSKLAISPFQHIDMLWRTAGALVTPTAIYSPLKRGGSDRLGLGGLKLPDRLGGQSLDRLSIPTGRLPGPMKIPSLMVDMFKVQFFTTARQGTTDFMISPTRINKDFPLEWKDLVQKHGLNVHGDYSVLAEDMREGVLAIMQPKMVKQPDGTMKRVWLYPGAPIGAGKTMARAVNKLNDFFVTGLFDGVYSVIQKYAIENFILPAMRRNHPSWTPDQVGAAVAENSNMIFSALGNWQTFLKDRAPELQQLLQIAAFSTGETESLMRSAARAFMPRKKNRQAIESSNPLKAIPAEHQGGIPYRRSKKIVMSPHWGIHAEHMLGLFVTIAFAANVINKYATGEGDNPAERFKNGRWLGLDQHNPLNFNDPYATFAKLGYNGGFLSPMSPWGKGRNGTDVFLDLVGQQDTAFKWLLSPLDSLTSRYNTLPRALYNQIQGEAFNGVPYNTPLQRVGAAVADIALPISLLNGIQAVRKVHPEAWNLSSVTLPGEDRLSPAQLLGQGAGQNQRAMDSKALSLKIELLPKNSALRKQFEKELRIRGVEAAVKGDKVWQFITSSAIKEGYEHWKGDEFMMDALDQAVDALADRNNANARRRSTMMPRWRYRELGYSGTGTLSRDKKGNTK